MTIHFVSSNKHKFKDAQESLREFGIELKQVDMDLIESRSELPSQIAKDKARQAYKVLKQPVLVDDSGFFIPALGGFPMTHIKFALKTLGIENLIKLMDGVGDRTAFWSSTVVYFDGKTLKRVSSKFKGTITHDIRPVKRPMSSDLWRIFIPERSSNPDLLALSEMSGEYARKNDEFYVTHSHFQKMGRWLIKHQSNV